MKEGTTKKKKKIRKSLFSRDTKSIIPNQKKSEKINATYQDTKTRNFKKIDLTFRLDFYHLEKLKQKIGWGSERTAD